MVIWLGAFRPAAPMTSVLSIYESKMILDHPNCFGQVQIIKISPGKFNLNLTKIILTQRTQLEPDQNNLNQTKTICTRPREG